MGTYVRLYLENRREKNFREQRRLTYFITNNCKGSFSSVEFHPNCINIRLAFRDFNRAAGCELTAEAFKFVLGYRSSYWLQPRRSL